MIGISRRGSNEGVPRVVNNRGRGSESEVSSGSDIARVDRLPVFL